MKAIIAAVFYLLALPALAIDFEIGAGQTQWTKPPNSQYWQQEFPNTFDLNSPAYYVGVTDYLTRGTSGAWYDKGHDGIRWRFGWLDLGNVRGEAWATSEDWNYSGTGGGCHDMSRCRPEDLNKWDTYGRTKGFEASLAPEWVVGPTRVFVKAGLYFHRPRIGVRIYREENDPGRMGYDYKERVNVGPTIGVGFTYKNTTLTFSCYRIDATSKAEPDPTNDEDPQTIPPNFSSEMCGTKTLLATWSF